MYVLRTSDCERERPVVQHVKTCRIGGELPRELFSADSFCSSNCSIMREYRYIFDRRGTLSLADAKATSSVSLNIEGIMMQTSVSRDYFPRFRVTIEYSVRIVFNNNVQFSMRNIFRQDLL